MKHLIKKSEFYDAYVDRKDYKEVFKNPTSKEADLDKNSLKNV